MTTWRGILYGVAIVLILNSFVFPYLLGKKIIETDYGTFISQVESGKVKEVSMDRNSIYFVTQEDGKVHFYKTGAMDDPRLVERLLGAQSSGDTGKIVFNKQIPKENSPLVDFLLMWVIPATVFYLLWWQMGRLMQHKMGGDTNVLSFGKSGA